MESDQVFHYLNFADSIEHCDLDALMSFYGNDVLRYAYAITGNKQLSEDIAQEVFISVYRHIGSFRGRSSFKTWLFAITRNLAVNELRSGYLRRIVLFEWVKPREYGKSAEDEVIESQSRQDLRSIVLGLPIKLREVLILYYEHGLTMTEIANVMNISEGTVKSRLHRARKAVEKKWKDVEQ